MPRELPSGADLAKSGYRGFNLDVEPSGRKLKQGPAENKAVTPTAENKAAPPEDLESKAMEELQAMAADRGIEVKRSKGKGAPLKADYIKALR